MRSVLLVVDGERDAAARVWYVTGGVCIWLNDPIPERHLEPKQLLGRRDVQPHQSDYVCSDDDIHNFWNGKRVASDVDFVRRPFAIDDNRRSGQLQVFRSIEWLVCRHAGAAKLHLLAVNGLSIDKQRVGCRCEFQRDSCAHPDSAYRFLELDR